MLLFSRTSPSLPSVELKPESGIYHEPNLPCVWEYPIISFVLFDLLVQHCGRHHWGIQRCIHIGVGVILGILEIKYPSGSEILRIKVVPRSILCYGILGSSSIFKSGGPADVTVAETKLMKRHLLSFRPLQLWEFTPHPILARLC